MFAWLGMAAFCSAAATLSIALQGFEFGIDNNAFHIPIVLRWYDLPQFASDPLIQSLRHYATPVYPFLSLFADTENIRAIFFLAFFLTRALTIFALFQLMRACGLKQPWLTVATVTTVFISAIYGQSSIGRDELFVDIFTHTALAQAVALLGIASLIRGKLLWAALAMGIAFDLNAIVGAWTAVPLALACMGRLVSKSPHDPTTAVKTTGVFTLVAAPVVIWIVATQGNAIPNFDYRAFLVEYYPYHFFIGWADWPHRIEFALQLACGAIGILLLPRNRAGAALVLSGLALVFCLGVLVGQLSHAHFLLNLHLLRVDGMILWLAVCVIVTVGFNALAAPPGLPALGGAAAISGLIANDWRIVLAGLLWLAATRYWSQPPHMQWSSLPRIRPSRLVASGALFIYAAANYATYAPQAAPPGRDDVPSDQQLAGDQPAAPQWRQVTEWARAETAPNALFLVPPKMDFIAAAQRRSWTGWKEGAAAMWEPGIYVGWHARTNAVAALHNTGAMLAYACANRIDYVVFDRRPGRALPGITRQPVFENRWFAVVAASACPQHVSRS
ncbi:MAG TPA: DUF6798 domain-containing protein [Rhizomicrobium sp.]|jgi:hypothetical protein